MNTSDLNCDHCHVRFKQSLDMCGVVSPLTGEYFVTCENCQRTILEIYEKAGHHMVACKKCDGIYYPIELTAHDGTTRVCKKYHGKS